MELELGVAELNDEPRLAAAEFVGQRIAEHMTVIYSREAPYMGYYQNGLYWQSDEGRMHRIRTNIITGYMPLVYTLDASPGYPLAGWYLVHTASEHDYIVYYSPQNPEYVPLRANPPVL